MKFTITLLFLTSLVFGSEAAPRSSFLTGGVVTPGYATIAPGSNPGMLTCTRVTGGSCAGSYHYQWQQSSDNSSWQNTATGDTLLNYSPGSLSSTHYYRVQITCSASIYYSN